jgi:soluble lytic murein transglycosylase-like protein
MARYTKDQLIARIQQVATGAGIDPSVAYYQLLRESGFRDDVVYGPTTGGSGERGVAQFMPGTWARFGSGPHTNAYDPDASLTAWAGYMTWLLARYGGNYTKALQGYNGGEGHVDRGTVSQDAKNYAAAILAQAGRSPAPTSSGIPPVVDTGQYQNPFEYGPDSSPGWLVPVIILVGLGVWWVLDD